MERLLLVLFGEKLLLSSKHLIVACIFTV